MEYTLDQLKSHAFDVIRNIEILDKELKAVNAEIIKMEKMQATTQDVSVNTTENVINADFQNSTANDPALNEEIVTENTEKPVVEGEVIES